MKKTENKKEDKSWFQKLWKSQEQIEKDARHYDDIPWYFAPRYGAIFLLFVQNFAGFITGMFGFSYLCLFLAVFLPLFFLIARGYRFFIALTTIVYTFDRFYDVLMFEYFSIAGMFWWLATAYMLVLSYRIEAAKAKLNKGKSTFWRDIVIALILGALFWAVTLWFYYYKPAVHQFDEALYWKGFIYRNTDGIQEYCDAAGVDMNTYTQYFNTKYATNIELVNTMIAAEGMNPDTVLNDLPMDEARTRVTVHFDALRTIVNSSALVEQTDGNIENVVLQEEAVSVLPKADFCSFVNRNPAIMEVIDHDFELFAVGGNLLAD